jgi:hypothetical protein
MSEKKEDRQLTSEAIKLRRDQWNRLRLLRQAMEEKLERKYTMSELFEHLVDDFLAPLDDKKPT